MTAKLVEKPKIEIVYVTPDGARFRKAPHEEWDHSGDVWMIPLVPDGHLPQSQQSTVDQLHELRIVANRRGLYDAADWLMTRLRELEGLGS